MNLFGPVPSYLFSQMAKSSIYNPLRFSITKESDLEYETVHDDKQCVELNLRLVKKSVRPAYRGPKIEFDLDKNLVCSKLFTITHTGLKISCIYHRRDHPYMMDWLLSAKGIDLSKTQSPAQKDCLLHGHILGYLNPLPHQLGAKNIQMIGWRAGTTLLFVENVSDAIKKETLLDRAKLIQWAIHEHKIRMEIQPTIRPCAVCKKVAPPVSLMTNQHNGLTLSFCSRECTILMKNTIAQ